MKIWAKIVDDKIVYPPENDRETGTFNVNKNEPWLLKHGFSQWTHEALEPYQPASAEPVERYSTLKIIRALGDAWETYRTRLSEAGYLDQFFAANYLAANDPVFLAFMENVPEEEKELLEQCLWSE